MPQSQSNAGLALTTTFQTLGNVCPSNTGQMVRLSIANTAITNNSNVYIQVYRTATSTSYMIAYNVPIYARQTRNFSIAIALTPGDYIQVKAAANNMLTAWASVISYTAVAQLSINNAAAVLTTTPTTLYTCPTGKTAVLRFLVANIDPSGYEQMVNIAVFSNSINATYYLAQSAPIEPMLTNVFDNPINLQAGDYISMASVANSSVLSAYCSIMVNG